MPLPKDIVHEIIDYLYEDHISLISCSLVSRPFYRASRKHIFSSAYVDHESDVHALCSLLNKNPALAPFFRILHVTLAHSRTLSHIPRVLPLLTQVRQLTLGKRGEPVILNRGDTITAIPPLLHLPRLEKIELLWISNFPATYLCIPLKIKTLEMEFVDITMPARGNCLGVMAASRPMSLESIHVDMMENLKKWPSLNAPKLRQLSIQRPGRGTQQIINANAKSVRDVIWNNFDPRDCDVNFDIIYKLRRLSFVLLRPFATRTPDVWTTIENLWTFISDILCTERVCRGLEELNIAIKSHQRGMSSVHNDKLVDVGTLWSTLADKSRFPRLRRVTIFMEAEGCSTMITKENLHAVVSKKLILLEGAGLLHKKLCKHLHWHDFL
ncbi:hypothetical protein BDZ94DRAFT_1324673 [Collybia nuda]|uniref:F-box domain-containing protein n=1 Tax=Collybia nuda TaxID=64659 RepID=A0A9P5XXL4_9AGAR|nr:hypothetical protein BDZ94DRAFT_1324673 [Collybia nuda]